MPARCNEIEAASFYSAGASTASRRYFRSTEEMKINLVISEGRPFSRIFTREK